MIKYEVKEQKPFSPEEKNEISPLLDLRNNPTLGLNFDSDGTLWTSYFVGLDWLKENEAYILVQPKIKNLDYIKMFVHCLKHSEISKHVFKIYHFDFKQPKIKPDTQIEVDFTLFLIAHFLKLVEKIIEQGLKKNYVQIEENLNSKIKGKIVWSQQIKKNIAGKREDRVFCRYQEYSVNCLENRLLKRTLLMVQRYLKHFDKEQIRSLVHRQNRLLNVLENVSDNISYQQIKMLKINSLYNEYVEAIDLAKKIIQKFGYSFAGTDNKEKQKEISPFWIDMSKLFELYVYSKLRDKFSNIDFQFCANHRYLDYLINEEKIKMVVDAKYKLYDLKSSLEIEDVRQVSAYARMEKVREELRKEEYENIDCLIIYPCSEEDTFDCFFVDFQNDNGLDKYKEKAYAKFYKCGIKLPVK